MSVLVPIAEGELAHLLGGDPLAAEVLATRTERVVDEDLEAVCALPSAEERDGVADVADALQRRWAFDVGGVAGQDGDVPVEEERDECLEVEVVGPERRVGRPPQGHHPAGCRGREGTALLLVGRRVRVVEFVPHPHAGPDERGRRRLVALWCPGRLAEAGAVDEREDAGDQAVIDAIGRELGRQLGGVRGQVPRWVRPVGGHQWRTFGRSTDSSPADVSSSGTSTDALTSYSSAMTSSTTMTTTTVMRSRAET